MRIRPLYMLEAGAINYWLRLSPFDAEVDGVTTFAAASWTGRYRRLVGIETNRYFWRWWE